MRMGRWHNSSFLGGWSVIDYKFAYEIHFYIQIEWSILLKYLEDTYFILYLKFTEYIND